MLQAQRGQENPKRRSGNENEKGGMVRWTTQKNFFFNMRVVLPTDPSKKTFPD